MRCMLAAPLIAALSWSLPESRQPPADGCATTAGTTDNNTEFESYPGCSTGFNVSIGQNDSSTAYSVLIAPSVHVYYLYNGSAQVRPGLPQGASFTQLDAAGKAFVFHWEHALEYVGLWSVCFDLEDNVNIKNLRRCISVRVHRCLRCIQVWRGLGGWSR